MAVTCSSCAHCSKQFPLRKEHLFLCSFAGHSWSIPVCLLVHSVNTESKDCSKKGANRTIKPFLPSTDTASNCSQMPVCWDGKGRDEQLLTKEISVEWTSGFCFNKPISHLVSTLLLWNMTLLTLPWSLALYDLYFSLSPSLTKAWVWSYKMSGIRTVWLLPQK